MQIWSRFVRRGMPSLSFVFLIVLLLTLWIAGGASRGDVSGQVIVRASSWILLAVFAVLGSRPSFDGVKPALVFLLLGLALALAQLVPLPPLLWQSLPGREPFAEAVAATAQSQPWRPWSIVPDATHNATASLVVPLATLVFLASLKAEERSWVPSLLLCLVVSSALIGLLQFSGAQFNNPFINDSPGQISASFANRNHFALFLAFGCLLAPVWAFSGGRQSRWRGPIAVGLVLLFALTILASGSRAGILVGALALGIGLALSWQGIRRELRRAPRWALPALVAAIVGTVAIFVLISIAADRAESINRAFSINPGEDMRRRALPTVLAMIATYFPVGTGFGSFDPLFRMHEPLALLKRTYFNHAHNDFIEIVLDGGLPALLLLLSTLGWWAFATVRVWRGTESRFMLSRLGSAMLLLVFIASAFDYPARTPMMMALIVIAAVWLSQGAAAATRSALRERDQHL